MENACLLVVKITFPTMKKVFVSLVTLTVRPAMGQRVFNVPLVVEQAKFSLKIPFAMFNAYWEQQIMVKESAWIAFKHVKHVRIPPIQDAKLAETTIF